MSDNTELYQRAIGKFGRFDQILKAIEELGELSTELARIMQSAGDLKSVWEEIADVEIMCEQLRIITGDNLTGMVNKIKAEKIERLRRLIDGAD